MFKECLPARSDQAYWNDAIKRGESITAPYTLRNLFMFPRQMSFEFVNSILYQIVFIAIIIILTRNIVYKKGRIS